MIMVKGNREVSVDETQQDEYQRKGYTVWTPPVEKPPEAPPKAPSKDGKDG